MSNKKKFENPFNTSLRLEVEHHKIIISDYHCFNDFVVDAIVEKLKADGKIESEYNPKCCNKPMKDITIFSNILLFECSICEKRKEFILTNEEA